MTKCKLVGVLALLGACANADPASSLGLGGSAGAGASKANGSPGASQSTQAGASTSGAGAGIAGATGSSGAGQVPVVVPPATDAIDRDGVVVWLDAERGVLQQGERVQTWMDQSDAHNDFKQMATDKQPLLVPGAIAGRALLRFERTRKTVLLAQDSDSLHFGRDGLTVLLAAANRTPIEGGHGESVATVLGKQQVGPANVEIILTFNWFTTETEPDEPALHIGIGEGRFGPVSNFRKYNDGKFRIITGAWRADGDALDMSIFANGKLDGHEREPSAPDLSLSGQPLRLGESYGQAVTADIAELVVLKGTPSEARVTAWQTYLMAKYGVTPTP